MERRKGFMLLLGFIGLLVVNQFFSYRRDENIKAGRIPQVQEQRQKLMQERCRGDPKAFLDGKHTWNNISTKEFKNFIVDDRHGIIYCYIPKVACTNWKRVMIALNHSEPYPDPVSIDPDSVHKKKHTLLSSFSRAEIKLKLRHYTKFLFVRDPFVRLISAYRDKFLHHTNTYFYWKFGRVMLQLYDKMPDPPKTVKKALKLRLHPSFNSFIQYLLDPRTEMKEPFEPHWRQMYRLCHPCLIKYDFIGHQETLKDDATEFLKMLKLKDDIKFPPVYENVTSLDSVKNWFRTVSLQDRRRLYKLYEQDFRLFGYRRPSELLDG